MIWGVFNMDWKIESLHVEDLLQQTLGLDLQFKNLDVLNWVF